MRALISSVVIGMKRVNNLKKYLGDKIYRASLTVDYVCDTESCPGPVFLACITELQRAGRRADLHCEEGQLHPLSGT